MSIPLNSKGPPEAGSRLRIARESIGMSQAVAAEHVGIARTTLVAIENGSRRIRINELQELAALYGTTLNSLFREEAIHVDLVPRFRRIVKDADEPASKAVELLAALAKAEVELENLLGTRRTFNLPPQRPLLPGDVRTQAEQDAQELRERLGLGVRPITDVVTLLELEFGARVYVRRLDSSISGLFVYDEAIGACILLNASHPLTRRAFSAAHECGHLVSVRENPDVLHSSDCVNSREERYANAFARAFLTPARGVMQKFEDIVADSGRLTRRHVIILAHYFGVSREALVRRLEELDLTKEGTWDWFVDQGGITNEQELQVLGDLRPEDHRAIDADQPTTLRINLLASRAYEEGLMSEGQLARLLKLDRLDVRKLLTLEDDVPA